MTEQTDATRRDRARWLVRAALVLVALLASLAVGVTTARTEGGFGPHLAEYAVTTDGLVVVDLGPLGTLEVDSPLPLSLGTHVTVQEIPASLTEVDDATTLQALSGDLQRYVQFFSAPQTTIADVTQGLVRDALRRATVLFVAMVALWWLGRVALGATRRGELARSWGAHRARIAGGTAIVVLVATVGTSSTGPSGGAEVSRPVSHVFDGTALEGARVTGRLGGVIDTYGAKVLAAYRTNQEFYERADASLAAAWDERAEIEALQARAQQTRDDQLSPSSGRQDDETSGGQDDEQPDEQSGEQSGEQGDAQAGGGADAADDRSDGQQDQQDQQQDVQPDGQQDDQQGDQQDDEAAGDESGEPTGATSSPTAPTPSPTPTTPEEDLVVLVVVSDLHCNVSMAPLITTLAERSGASIVLDAGDTTMNGTAVEQYCTSTFASAVPDGVHLVVSPGNHDSASSAAAYADAGARVLSGKVVEVDGLRILGDSDPNETRAGAGTASLGESAVDAGARLGRTACDEGGVDLLLIHTPAVGEPALESGCVPAQVSGHLHRRTDPRQVGLGIRYLSSSTAGATLGEATVGPLNGTAEMTVLRWDPATRLMVDYQVVRITPDAKATVQARRPWPAIVLPDQSWAGPFGGTRPA